MNRFMLTLLVVLSLRATARADQATDRARAVSALRAGNRLLEVGRAREALLRFEEALRLTGSPKLLYNIGQAQRDLPGHEVEAYQSFDQYLDKAPDAASGTRAEAERMRSELRYKVAFVSVTTLPAGAMISVDGAGRGATPLALVVQPGKHRLEVRLDAFVAPPEETVVLAGGQTFTRSLVLKAKVVPKPPAAVSVRVAPAPAVRPVPAPQAASFSALAAGVPAAPNDANRLTLVADDRSATTRPLYERWWVWGASAVLVTAAVVVLVAVSGSGGGVSHACPPTSTSICAPLPP